MADSYTRTLARWIANYRYEDTPPEVIDRLKWMTLDTLGCGIFGVTLPWSQIATEMVTSMDDTRRAAIWGTSSRTSTPNAALLNGTFVQSYELDDSGPGSHIGAGTIPAALGVAEDRGGVSGRQLLGALVAGYEMAIRISRALPDNFSLMGWHPAGILGPFLAATSVGKILGLDEDRMVHALGLAGNRGMSLEAARVASMDKRMMEGRGAMNGVHSALLAERGFTGAEDIFEVEKGFLRTFTQSTDNFDLSQLTKELGQSYYLMNVSSKKYAANGSTHTSIEAAKAIKDEHHVRAEDIAKIRVGVSKVVFGHTNPVYHVESINYAQFCIPFVVATMFLEGDVFVAQFSEEKIRDPKIVDLASKVEVYNDPELDTLPELIQRRQSRMKVELKSGQTLEHTQLYRPGDPGLPLTTEEFIDKFRKLASVVMGESQVNRVVEMVGDLEKMKDVSTLAKQLAVPPGQ